MDIIDTNNPAFVPLPTSTGFGNFINPALINGYSCLAVPPYKRAIDFLSRNLASFPRSVLDKSGAPVDGHPLESVLNKQPNQYQTAASFWTTWFFHAVHKQAAYAKIVRTESGITGLYNLDPDTITPFRVFPTDDDGNIIDPEGGEQWFYDKQYKRVLAYYDVLFLHGLSYDGMQGFEPAKLHADTFIRAHAYDRFLTKFILKGTWIKAWVGVEPGATPEQQAGIRDALRAFKGENQNDDIPILGGAKLYNDSISPKDSELDKQVQLNTKQIAQLTGVPQEILFEGGESKYNANLAGMSEYVVTYTLRPWIVAAEDELTLKLLSSDEQQQGRRIRIDPNALLRGSTVTESNVVAEQKGAGLISANEGRKLLGYPKSDDPSADKLIALGDTTPGEPPAGPVPPAKTTNSNDPSMDAYEAIKPILMDAAERIERKSLKAFDDAKNKKDVERTAWANVFAQQQSGYCKEQLTIIASSMKKITGTDLDVTRLCNQYEMEIKGRAAGNDAKSLATYVGEMLNARNQ